MYRMFYFRDVECIIMKYTMTTCTFLSMCIMYHWHEAAYTSTGHTKPSLHFPLFYLSQLGMEINLVPCFMNLVCFWYM